MPALEVETAERGGEEMTTGDGRAERKAFGRGMDDGEATRGKSGKGESPASECGGEIKPVSTA